MYSQGRKPLISVNPLPAPQPAPPLAFYSREWLRLSGEPAWPKPHHHLQTEVCDACGFCSLPSQSHNTPWEFWSQTISTSPPIPKPVWNCNFKGMEKNFDSDILRINLKLFLPTKICFMKGDRLCSPGSAEWSCCVAEGSHGGWEMDS